MKSRSARGTYFGCCFVVALACGSGERRDRGPGSDDAGEGGMGATGTAGVGVAGGGSSGKSAMAGTSGSPASGSAGAGSSSGGAGGGGSAGAPTGGTTEGGEAGSGGTGGGGSAMDGGSSGASGTSGAGGGTCEEPRVLFLVDTSRSMLDEFLSGTRWDYTRDVLVNAVDQLPDSLRAGLLFFPQVSSAMMPPCFDVATEIPIAPLDGSQREAFIDAFREVVPDGGTPTYDAFTYASERLAELDADGPNVIVLVTDGVPNYFLECEGNAVENVDWEPLVEMVAAASEAGTHTLAVAAPGDVDTYEMAAALGAAGGNLGPCQSSSSEDCFFMMEANPDLGAWLLESLAALAARCTASR
ncbi:MAG TPA: vWA domain-containing protein [Polyangiaceae bacterium]